MPHSSLDKVFTPVHSCVQRDVNGPWIKWMAVTKFDSSSHAGDKKNVNLNRSGGIKYV